MIIFGFSSEQSTAQRSGTFSFLFFKLAFGDMVSVQKSPFLDMGWECS